MKNKLLIMFGVLMIFGYPLFIEAQEEPDTLLFTLQEAQEYAIQHNLTVQNAALDVDIAQKKVWETTAIGLPQVNATTEYMNNLSIATMLIPNFFEGRPEEKIPVKFGTQHNLTASITASQLIFSGPYIVGLQASRIYQSLSKDNLERSKIEVKELVAQNYYLILLAENVMDDLTKNVVNIRKLYEETNALFENGFAEETDVDQLKVTLVSIENAIKAMERQVTLSYNLLKFQMGLEVQKKIKLTDELNEIIGGLDLNSLMNNQFNLTDNVTYRLIETQEKLSALNLKKEKYEYLPSLSAFYSYQQNAMRDEFNFMNSSEDWFETQILGISLEIPIFSSGMKRSKVSQRKLELIQAQNTKQFVSESLNLEYKQAQFDYNNALEKYLNQKDNVALAEKVLNRTGIKFKEGMSSSFELTQANNQYLQTNSDYITALVELLNAKIRLDKVLNRL